MTSMPPPFEISIANDKPIDFIPASNEQLADELTRLAGHINAAEYRFLKLLAALIERDAWGGDSGMKTPAHWLNYYCGIALGAAREKVRVARALQSLPQIDAEFATGSLSYSKVRAMTRCATPENENVLLNIARQGTAAHLEKLLRRHRRVQCINCQKQVGPVNREQALSYYHDDDGMLVLSGRFSAEDGAVVIKALEMVMQSKVLEKNSRLDSKQTAAEQSEGSDPELTFPRRRADALLQLAEHVLACPDQQATCLSSSDKYQVLVHLDLRQTSGSARISRSGFGYLEDGPPLSPETIERLSCDASLVPVLRDQQGNVLNIGRKSRAVPSAIRRALKIRDGGCRFPGCTQTRHVDAHHVRHWSKGGETSLDNLVLLCRHHHRLLHEGGFDIETGSELKFTDRQGNTIPPARYPQFTSPGVTSDARLKIEIDNERNGLAIDSDTAVSRWHGEQMDYSLVVGALQDRDLAMR